MSTESGQTSIFQSVGKHYYIGRQPILDTDEATYAYELLFRSGRQNSANVVDGRAATESVLNCALNVTGLSTLVGASLAFINVDEEVLCSTTYNILPRDRVVIELLEYVRPTERVLKACRRLKEKGFRLALDDFTDRDDYDELLAMADVVKVDFMGIGPEEREKVTNRLKQFPARLLAEKVETREDVDQAKALGYNYFQGYFYQKPDVIEQVSMSPSKETCMRLLQELNAESPDVDKVECLIKQDPALTTRLLCYINSAFFGLRNRVSSIGHGLKLMGMNQLRKWGSLIAIEQLSEGFPAELTRDCLIRGYFCEMLAGIMPTKPNQLDLFMMGMLSLVDTLACQPMQQIIKQLELNPEIAEALMGQDGLLGDALRLAMACEQFDHASVLRFSDHLSLQPDTVFNVHTKAMDTVYRLSA